MTPTSPPQFQLSDDLFLVVCALAHPSSKLPACSRQVYCSLTSSHSVAQSSSHGQHPSRKCNVYLSRAWHNHLLLSSPKHSSRPPLAGSRQLHVYRLNRVRPIGSLFNTAPSNLLNDDFVKGYLLSKNGPMFRTSLTLKIQGNQQNARHCAVAWWQPEPHLFHLVLWLMRPGYFDWFEFALRQVAAFAPLLAQEIVLPFRAWAQYAIDSKPRADVIAQLDRQLSPVRFPAFLAALAILRHWRRALEIILAAFDLAPATILDVLGPTFAPWLVTTIPTHRGPPHRLISMIQWFQDHGAPVATMPIAQHARSIGMFVALLAQVDLPHLHAKFAADAPEANAELIEVRTRIVRWIINNKLSVEQAQPIFALDIECQWLLTPTEWDMLFGRGNLAGGQQAHWDVVAASTAILQQSGFQMVHLYDYVLIKSDLQSNPPNRSNIQVLLDHAARIGLSIIDLLFSNIPAWDPFELTALFRMHRFASIRPTWIKSDSRPWFTPALVIATLDKIHGLDPPAMQFPSDTMHMLVHMVAKQFDICVRTLGAHTKALRDWFSEQSQAQLALLFACVWSALPSCDPLWPSLFSHASDEVIHLIPTTDIGRAGLPAWHALIPVFVLSYVRDRIQHETSAAVYRSLEESRRCKCQAQLKLVLDVDREWVVQALQCEGADPAFSTSQWR
ncbi:hypothetical protein BCR44DRAFT_23547 [Catenaria anguillulae PL171]|uniref:Uncharacterized protein n=1 Tax=Catenaria anguillulae PL171 TaxID=765915 RepID=A0A1Y2HQN4_9FUNG|nr:hypothetical protein BCR44DRAFT_23547 [Catenaria anguillulae PL171]